MNPTVLALLAAALGSPTPTPCPVAPPVCEDQAVHYASRGELWRDRIVIERPSLLPRPPLDGGDRRRSPHGTRWLVAVEPDFTRPGPWNTTMAVFGNPSGAEMLRATFADHGSGGVRTTWLNEKLLFVQVWWGRIATSDLVLDIERGVPLYAEDADYGELIAPCDPRTPPP